MKNDSVLDLVSSRSYGVKKLRKLNIDAFMASGFKVSISKLSGEEVINTTVGISSKENIISFENIKDELINIILENLKFNKNLLNSHINMINEVLDQDNI